MVSLIELNMANPQPRPTYAEAIVAVGPMLTPKAGEPQIRRRLKISKSSAAA
jgi:hypothetical protein